MSLIKEVFTPKRLEERTKDQMEKIKSTLDIAYQELESWEKVLNSISSFKSQSQIFLENTKSFSKQEKIDLIPYLQKMSEIAEATNCHEICSTTNVQLREAEILRDKKSYKFELDSNLSIRNAHDEEREIHFKYIDQEDFEYDVNFYFRYDNDLALFIPPRILKSGNKSRFDGHWELKNGAYICTFTMTEKDFIRMMLVMDNVENINLIKKDAYNFKVALKKK